MNHQSNVPDWTRRYRRERHRPLTILFRFCRRHCDAPWFIVVTSALFLALSYLTFLAFVWALVNSPNF